MDMFGFLSENTREESSGPSQVPTPNSSEHSFAEQSSTSTASRRISAPGTDSTHTPPPKGQEGSPVTQRSPGELPGRGIRSFLKLLKVQDVEQATELILEASITDTDDLLIMSQHRKDVFFAQLKASGLSIVDRTKIMTSLQQSDGISRYQARKTVDEEWITPALTATDMSLKFKVQDHVATIESRMQALSPDDGLVTPEQQSVERSLPETPETKTYELELRSKLSEAADKLKMAQELMRLAEERAKAAEKTKLEGEARIREGDAKLKQAEDKFSMIRMQTQAQAAQAQALANARDNPVTMKYVKVETPQISDQQDEDMAVLEIEQLYGHRPVECRRHLRLCYLSRRVALGRREARGWLRSLPEGEFSWDEWADWLRWLDQQDRPLEKLPWKKLAPHMEAYFSSVNNQNLIGEASLLPGFDDYRKVGYA